MSLNTPHKFLFIISLTFFIALITLVLSSTRSISADSVFGGASGKQDISSKFGLKKNSLVLESAKTTSGYQYSLVRKKWFSNDRVLLTGFEDEIDLCQHKEIGFENAGQVCLVGTVGAHSYNLEVIDFSGNVLKPVEVLNSDSISSPNISSDLPAFKFSDEDSDGKRELIVYNRDYDSDPLNFAFKTLYRSVGSSYIFDRREKIEYHISDSN